MQKYQQDSPPIIVSRKWGKTTSLPPVFPPNIPMLGLTLLKKVQDLPFYGLPKAILTWIFLLTSPPVTSHVPGTLSA